MLNWAPVSGKASMNSVPAFAATLYVHLPEDLGRLSEELARAAIASAWWKVKTLLGRRDGFSFPESASRGRLSLETAPSLLAGTASHLSHSDTVKDELSRDGLHRIRRYNEKSITVAVGLICIALAATLLIGTIVGFSYVSSWSAKVGMICAFTIAFALCWRSIREPVLSTAVSHAAVRGLSCSRVHSSGVFGG
ncbi:hypothetical protein BDP67DRAFT_495588 [Colletotrichum lupini]|nr:hypothetical protein BDP67DRAFT_495588 [Colletotrichum lupini]